MAVITETHVSRRSLRAATGRFVVALAMSFTLGAFARANVVVTLCHSADETGTGTNLQNAMAVPPDPNSLVNTITFQCNGPATIQITHSYSLWVGQATVIDGGNDITLDGGGTQRLFQEVPKFNSSLPSLSLNNLTLQNAKVPPADCSALLCPGSVISGAMSVQVHHCQILNSGLAILMTAPAILTVDDTRFVGASIFSGATQTTISRSVFQDGSSIIAAGTVSLSGSTFSNNDVSHFETCQQLTIDRSTFKNNKIQGALRIGCNSTISHSSFEDNAGTDGGAIFVTRKPANISLRAVKFLRNTASRGGGAIAFDNPHNSTRNITISYSTFTNNKAATKGGAIAVSFVEGPFNNPGVTSINAHVVSFSGNNATSAGGAVYGTYTLLGIGRGVFADNVAYSGSGGAIALDNFEGLAESVFANTLFIRNRASITGSAFLGDNTKFINSTVDSNLGLAISIASQRKHGSLPITFTNSILSNNSLGSCGPTVSVGLFKDGLNNLQFPGTDCGASIKVANPHLDTMYIPLPKSPPMGNGNLTVCMSQPINGRDVYGVGRPSGGSCTIGAAEGDMEVLVSKRTRRLRPGECDCGASLLKQLQRVWPFGRVK